LISLLVAALVSGATVAHAQSLGDVARRAERVKATTTSPAKVYTGRDIRDTPATATPVADTAPQAAPGSVTAAATQEANTPTPADTRNPAFWKARLRQLQARLETETAAVTRAAQRVDTLASKRAVVPLDQRAAADAERLAAAAELAKLNQAMRATAMAIDETRAAAISAGVSVDSLSKVD
jgi:hypothetical protein